MHRVKIQFFSRRRFLRAHEMNQKKEKKSFHDVCVLLLYYIRSFTGLLYDLNSSSSPPSLEMILLL